jgi:hypothetical protein
MNKASKKLSNAFSTGGGGHHFEAHVQASFVALMLTGGYSPSMPCWPIVEVKLQGSVDGYETDDLVVCVEDPSTKERRKILCQVKHSIGISKGDKIFGEVMKAAWADFNNSSLFKKTRDVIALITGPLSHTDHHNVQWLLGQARSTRDAAEFYTFVNRANFSPPKSAEKLEAINHHLQAANGGSEVSQAVVYQFLRDFHLIGYDLGGEFGVVLSLLHSHMAQFQKDNTSWLWGRLVDFIQTRNQNAGTVTWENIPGDLKQAFARQDLEHIPNEFTARKLESLVPAWTIDQNIAAFAVLNLVGAWNENVQADVAVVDKISNEPYLTLAPKIREFIQLSDSPLSLHNGVWSISEREASWSASATRIFDKNLDDLKEVAVSVLTERDPSFELVASQRYASAIHGKSLQHSSVIRKGIAETLALIGSRPAELIHCTRDKPEAIAMLAVREILSNADWVLWGSLNGLLPTLAEASPREFLHAVENALQSTPCPFDELFSQEGDGISGGNYLTGLLWALETLAWDETHLVRVCVLLGELASHDPGGKWANRPANSLATILLPWLPQTRASVEKRKVAVQTVCKESPDIGWSLVINLLPNHLQSSSGSHRPVWRNPVPDDWKKGVVQQEYWDQTIHHAELAVSLAGMRPDRLAVLARSFNNLPQPSFDRLLKVLSSDEVCALPEEERVAIWDKLVDFTRRHRRYSDAKWALGTDLIASIEKVAEKLAPTDPMYLHRKLFSGRDFDLYDENNNWQEQQEKLKEARQQAVRDILSKEGTGGVIVLSESVASPNLVGYALASEADETTDEAILPKYMDGNDRHEKFASGYVWGCHHLRGGAWPDSLDKSKWSPDDMAKFLTYLPFTSETWNRALIWLGDDESLYWKSTQFNAFQAENDIEYAIEKLISVGRPQAAIDCLATILHQKKPIKLDLAIRSLLDNVRVGSSSGTMDVYHVTEIIKHLQENDQVDQNDLFQVEWSYLPILDGHHGAKALTLENRLATDAGFFCEVIRLIYRSKNEDQKNIDTSEQAKLLAINAWRLLRNWKIPPGHQADGTFDDVQFTSWLDSVKEICEASGHLEVALITVGSVLIWCPPDDDGFWIKRAVAGALNEKAAEEIRSGFRTGIHNSRGVHWVDPEGKPELQLAEQYLAKAESTEIEGFQRLASTLRDLSEDYKREAKHNIENH